MQLSFEHFTVELINESSYDMNSSDNSNSYQHHYFAEERNNYTNCHGIKVTGTEHEFNAIVLANGGSTGIHSNCATVHSDELLICCGDHVFCLTLPTLELKWKVKVDMATAFEIRPIDDGYIVHGELQISRVDNSGNIVWQQGGADIFVNPDGTDNFELTPEHIQVTDWNNKTYTFDFNGVELNE